MMKCLATRLCLCLAATVAASPARAADTPVPTAARCAAAFIVAQNSLREEVRIGFGRENVAELLATFDALGQRAWADAIGELRNDEAAQSAVQTEARVFPTLLPDARQTLVNACVERYARSAQ